MIYLNGKELSALRAEDKEIERVLLGGSVIWENVKAIYLGNGATFNVSNISGFENFTVNNFFVRVSGHPSVSDSVTGTRPGGVTGGIYTYLNKSYNATTGVFSFNYQAITADDSSSTVGGDVFLIPQLSKALAKGKLVNLGSGKSWNIKSLYPNDYQNFTIANFFVQSATTGQTGARYYEGTFSYAGYGTLGLSYNASTGILTGSNSITMTNTGGGYIESRSYSINPYLILKAAS